MLKYKKNMRQLLIDKPEGLEFYPFISTTIEGQLSCISKAPPFWIENLSNEECTITLSNDGSPTSVSLDYSIDSQSAWETFTTDGAGSFVIPANSKAYVKGDNSTFSSSYSNYYKFSFSQQCNVGGNIMSLVGERETLETYMFCGLFYQNANLVDASQLVLPATTLANNCYNEMFNGCTSLTAAPALPATTLANNCYGSMFSGCTSLTTAPALPATTLAYYCYGNMFSGCTSLVSAPELPATTLANWCYSGMFCSCTSLTSAPELSATTLANFCYYDMFRDCTSLVAAPALPATTLSDNCYRSMFSGCTSLVAAPALPATTLADSCYSGMFFGCASLAAAPALPATTLADRCYDSMFSGCTSLAAAPEMHYGKQMEQIYCEHIFYNTSINIDGYPLYYFNGYSSSLGGSDNDS